MGAFEGLGKALRWLRQEKELKQYQVAKGAAITRPMLSAYETGRQKPTLETLNRILSALDCELRDLFEALQLVSHRSSARVPLPKAAALLQDSSAAGTAGELDRVLGLLDGTQSADTREQAAFGQVALALLHWLSALREEALQSEGCSG